MILNHFRTRGVRNTLFTMQHVVKMQSFGTNQIDQFYQKWMEMTNNMLPEDTPPDDWLRDSLHKKIRNSHLLMFDIKHYESWDEGDNRKTYRHLRNVIERAIARTKEDKHTAARDKYARESDRKTYSPHAGYAGTKAWQSSQCEPKGEGEAESKAEGKVRPCDSIPSPQPKQHAKGKGKGRPRSTSKSASPSPKDKKNPESRKLVKITFQKFRLTFRFRFEKNEPDFLGANLGCNLFLGCSVSRFF